MPSKKDLTPFGVYIWDLCQARNWSLREASMKAGLAPETLSKILRRGASSTPRPDTIQQIADALGGDFVELMRLAGHIETPAVNELRPKETQRRVEEISEILSDLPVDLRDELINALAVQAETARTIFEACVRYDARPQRDGKEEVHSEETEQK